jgi:septum formation protein
MSQELLQALKKIVLISASPRRKALLESLGLQPVVSVVQTDESIRKNEKPVEYALRIARNKMNEYFKNHQSEQNVLYITTDTIVTIDGIILQKPENPEDALKMLTRLSGRKHEVVSGVSLVFNDKQITFFEKSEVWFKKLRPEEIEWYIRTGEPFDKAGGYGIQGYAKLFIRKIDGCYFNIVGFPVNRFYEECAKLIGVSDV